MKQWWESAARLYAAGLSERQVGRQLGRDGSAVHYALVHMGISRRPAHIVGTGSQVHNFRGSAASYRAKHMRIYSLRGRATSCVFGCTASRYAWANLTGNYDDPFDFAPMCYSCHERFGHAVRMTLLDVLPKRSRWRPDRRHEIGRSR